MWPGRRETHPMPTINGLTFLKTDAPAAEVFMGVLNRACPWLATWVAIRWHFSSATEGLYWLSVSDIPSYWSVFGRNIFKRSDFRSDFGFFGRIMIKPTDCSLSVFNASSLLENRFRSLEKDTSLSRNTKKERIVFPFEKKSISLQLDYNFLRNAIKGHVLMNAFVKTTPRKV